MLNMSQMTAEELDAELQKGYDDVLSGKTKPAKEVFDEIRTRIAVAKPLFGCVPADMTLDEARNMRLSEMFQTDMAINEAEAEYKASGKLTDAQVAFADLRNKHFEVHADTDCN